MSHKKQLIITINVSFKQKTISLEVNFVLGEDF